MPLSQLDAGALTAIYPLIENLRPTKSHYLLAELFSVIGLIILNFFQP